MKTTILVFTIIFASLFLVNTTTSVANLATSKYDIWLDLNDDGEINIFDVVMVASAYGTTGTPFNKTAALLELQQDIAEHDVAIGNLVKAVGNIEVRLPQTGMISISAAAFGCDDNPLLHGSAYNTGVIITNMNLTMDAYFSAPVQLPHGVTITRITCYWHDPGDAAVICDLLRMNNTQPHRQIIDTLSSPGVAGPGHGSTVSTTTNYATIDNTYQYCLSALIPPKSVNPAGFYWLKYVIIEYQYSS